MILGPTKVKKPIIPSLRTDPARKLTIQNLHKPLPHFGQVGRTAQLFSKMVILIPVQDGEDRSKPVEAWEQPSAMELDYKTEF